jgi:hypothetical protein
MSMNFLVEPQNQGRQFVSSLVLKPLGRFISGLTSKPLWQFFLFGLKTGADGFFWFGLKTGGDGFLWFGIKTGSNDFFRFGIKTDGGFLVEPRNQGGGGFSGLDLKISSYGLVIWTSKSPTVHRLHHKTDRRMKTARARVEL